ncbi:MAG TPA: HAD-IA family hydrolase [Dermatophilaceae bacterium]|nr:HAD-IA family hydrolase [Dermatophilaceae bacterium]
MIAAAALFDMDGTLVDSTAVVDGLWAAFADRHGIDLPVLLRHAHGRRTPDTIRHFLPDSVGRSETIAAFEAEELEVMDGIVPVPGAAGMLALLRDAPVAVVTSAPRELAARRLRAAGLPVPDVMVAAEDVTEGKPSPQGYLAAAARLGLPPVECVAFEDAEAGLQAAIRSGAHTVVVGSHASALTAGLPRIRDFTELTVRLESHRLVFTTP